MQLNPSYLEENGRKVFAVLPIEEYEELAAHVEDLEDLLELRNVRKSDDASDFVPVEGLRAAVSAERAKASDLSQ